MRIDSHHHIWNLARHPQTWMTPEQAQGIGRDFSIDDWAASVTGTQVTHSIVVQTIEDPSETPELLALARRYPSILGVVGWIDFDRNDPEDQLDRLLDDPHSGALVSIRDLTQYREDLDWLGGDSARRAFDAAGARDLAVDLLITPATKPAATRAARSSPNTRFIINHLAKPDLDALDASDWGASMAELARTENVAIKLSGVATLTASFPSAGVHLLDYVEEALARFGADRILFGSDWPVSLLGSTYSALVESIENALASFSDSEQDLIWYGSALEWYRLALESESTITGIRKASP